MEVAQGEGRWEERRNRWVEGDTVGRKRVEKEINNQGGSHDGCGREEGIEGMENLT